LRVIKRTNRPSLRYHLRCLPRKISISTPSHHPGTPSSSAFQHAWRGPFRNRLISPPRNHQLQFRGDFSRDQNRWSKSSFVQSALLVPQKGEIQGDATTVDCL